MASPQAADATAVATTTTTTAAATGATPSTAAITTQKPAQPTDVPATSTGEDGLSRRPRDARLVHLILSAQGIHSYQERVPLQLLDFAYRYTSSVLSDALRLSAEGYTSTATTGTGGGGGGASGTGKRGGGGSGAADAGSDITVNSLRQAIASRQDYQFQGAALPKEWMLEQAAEKNRIALPRIEKSWGVQLPPEKYCLTGTGWSLKDLWESDEEDGMELEGGEKKLENGHSVAGGGRGPNGTLKLGAGGVNGADEREKDGDDEAMESFEDVFGGGNEDEDQEMGDG